MIASTISNVELSPHQQKVLHQFKDFIKNKEQRVFILRGYAGTGKTTLVRFFIKELFQSEINYKLMASTGRAAKVLTNFTSATASTIHSVIYNFKDFNQDLEEIVRQEDTMGVEKSGQLYLTFELLSVTHDYDQVVYIVDEASMISDIKDKNVNQAIFGSGKLLSDLMNYDKKGKFVFVGDESQLPPIEQSISPALSVDYFKQNFNINATESTLTEIIRQQQDNTIITASHRIRKLYQNPPKVKWGILPLGKYHHIQLHSDVVAMINTYLSLIVKKNYQNATFIAYSNSKCNNINTLIRTSLGMKNGIQEGDLLLVTQNNLISGFMNGDIVVVEQVKNTCIQKAQLTFQLVEVRELVTGRRYSQFIIVDVLQGNFTNLNQAQQKALFVDFYRRMKAIGLNQYDSSFKDMLYKDVYLNALRCVYGYAITCHKAQGGEWNEVCIDIPRNLTLNATSAAYQWIYTAITRAKKRLHIVKDFYIGP